jgi:glutathione S-transferase
VIVLYDIVAQSGLRPSPYCWRAKLCLRHKKLPFEARGIVYSEISTIGNGTFKSLPVIEDHGEWVAGSTNIANYLEAKSGPPLFPEDPKRLFATFVEAWVDNVVQAKIFPLVALRAYEAFPQSQRDYFRSTRERRLGMSLERARARSLETLPSIGESLAPARQILKQREFLAGYGPGYADYLLYGALKWQRLLSDDRLLGQDDPLESWYQGIDSLRC